MSTPRLVGHPPQWVGRTEELAVFQDAVRALGDGEGSVIWVEGEPGRPWPPPRRPATRRPRRTP